MTMNETRIPSAALVRVAAGMLLAANLSTATAFAQSGDESVRDFLERLSSITEPAAVEVAGGLANRVIESVRRFPEETATLIGVGLFAGPLATSSAGFTFTVDPQTGAQALKSDSFGSLFVERPLTNGVGVWSVGFNYQYARYNRLQGENIGNDGENVRDRGVFIIDNGAVYPDGVVQYLTETLFLDVTAHKTTFSATYGVSEFLDVGVVVPFMGVTVDGRRQRFFSLVNSFAADPAVRAEYGTPEGVIDSPPRCPLCITETTVSASGVGDLTLRAKFGFAQRQGSGVGLSADIRLPTGDEENLLGTGEPSLRLLALASRQLGRFVAYGNGGYSFGGLSDEVNFVGGVDAVLGSQRQVTVSFALVGQSLRDASRIDRVRTFDAVGLTGVRTTVDRALWTPDTVNTIEGAPGVKVQIGRSAVIAAAVLVPLNDAGFRSKISPVVGFDWTIN